MKLAGITLAFGALVTGLVAAWYWYQSSRIQVEPIWPEGGLGPVEPGERMDAEAGWIGGTLAANSKSAELNAKAAIWTACSVLLAGLSSILSAL